MASPSTIPAVSQPSSEAAQRPGRQGNGAQANQSIIVELERLKDLPAGWDRAHAERIDPQIIDTAQEFVRWLPDALPRLPQVVPMTRSRLQLEWHHIGRSLEIEFESPTQVHFLKWDPRDGTEQEDVLPVSDRERICELIQWFQTRAA